MTWMTPSFEEVFLVCEIIRTRARRCRLRDEGKLSAQNAPWTAPGHFVNPPPGRKVDFRKGKSKSDNSRGRGGALLPSRYTYP
jgi:hypothetical protein